MTAPCAFTPLFAGFCLAMAPAVAQAQETANVAEPSGAYPDAPEVALVRVAEGLADPVAVVSPPGDSGRLFVVERPGRIRILQDGDLMEEPFLDISADVLDAFLEQGLYDIAFHPDFAENGLFFVHFAELLRNGDSVIVAYTVSEENPNVADTESRA